MDLYKSENVPLVVINFSTENIYLPKGEIMSLMQSQSLDILEIVTETSIEPSRIECKMEAHFESNEKKFISSPADIDIYRKVDLQDAEITREHQDTFRELCNEYKDIFSTDSSNIGKTSLIEMKIDTGDSPSIIQKPYTLPLQHAAWVQKELEILEKVGVIVRSVSPWACPIVVVPKRTAAGESPKRRLCVDYRAVNGILPPVRKDFSKAKGILTLVSLPKIDEIYAQLKGSKIYSTFDMRSGYYHMVLSEKARPKQLLSPHMASENLKNAHLDWHKLLHIFRD